MDRFWFAWSSCCIKNSSPGGIIYLSCPENGSRQQWQPQHVGTALIQKAKKSPLTVPTPATNQTRPPNFVRPCGRDFRGLPRVSASLWTTTSRHAAYRLLNTVFPKFSLRKSERIPKVVGQIQGRWALHLVVQFGVDNCLSQQRWSSDLSGTLVVNRYKSRTTASADNCFNSRTTALILGLKSSGQ